jgi:hypothetical protein
MAFDFPNSPVVGTKFPLTPVSGVPNYTWDGEKWVVTSGAASNALSIVARTFTVSGTYVPTVGMVYCSIECVGGGGGGGGAAGITNTFFCAGGGGSGGYSRRTVSAAVVGSSQAVTIGAAGAGGAAGFTNGTPGSATSVGALCVANGGGAGLGINNSNQPGGGPGGSVTGAVGDVIAAGMSGGFGFYNGVNSGIDTQSCGSGGSSFFGGGGAYTSWLNAGNGNASNYGSGGAGGNGQSTNAAGGNGSSGFVIITEFISTVVAVTSSGVYAAPFDALAYNGMQINGSMEVVQQGGSTGTNNTYIGDGWKFLTAGAMVVSSACALAPIAPGFSSVLYALTTTPQTTLGASDYVVITQPIEGWRIVRLAWGTANAQPLTIGFWSCHTRTGVYSVSFRNGASNRSYVAIYTHNVSSISQYNVITVPGDTAGTWASDNTVGLQIGFAMAVGSALTAPSANAWSANNYLAAPGQVNCVTTTSDAIRLTGVVVLPGIQAPSAAQAPFIMRPFDQELLTCRRYFYNGNPALHGYIAPGAASRFSANHPVRMRATPTLTIITPLPLYDGSGTGTLVSVTTNYSTPDVIELDGGVGGTGLSAGRAASVYQPGGVINVDARL